MKVSGANALRIIGPSITLNPIKYMTSANIIDMGSKFLKEGTRKLENISK